MKILGSVSPPALSKLERWRCKETNRLEVSMFFSFPLASTHYVAQIKLTECRSFLLLLLSLPLFHSHYTELLWFHLLLLLVFFFLHLFFWFTFSPTFFFHSRFYCQEVFLEFFFSVVFSSVHCKIWHGKLKSRIARIWQQISIHCDNKKELNLNPLLSQNEHKKNETHWKLS